MNEINGYYQLSIHPTRINYYYTPFHRRSRIRYKNYDHEENNIDASGENSYSDSVASIQPEQFKSNSHYGKISKITERKITRSIDYLTYLAQSKRLPYTAHGKGLSFRLNFVTLTLSSEQIHTDNEISTKLLHPFLQSLRQKWNVTNYIWRAEKQGNGSLHYHIITDKFISWNELRNVWNRQQQRLGYITRYRENQKLWHRGGFHFRPELAPKWSRAAQLKAYLDGLRHDWNSPNSTDVHALKLVSNVKAYFKKYMTKEGQNSNIKGRLWGCSNRLSNLKGAQIAEYNLISNDLDRIKLDKSIKSYTSDFFTTIFITTEDLKRLGCTEILSVFESYIGSLFPDYRPPGLFD